MRKYPTKFKSKKNKRRTKINKSKRLRNKHSLRKYRKKTRKLKQKIRRRISANAGRPPPYTKEELLDAIRGLDFNRHRALTEDNPSLEKFEQLINLLKYVNWLHSIGTYPDNKLEEYIRKTDLVFIVNKLHNEHIRDNTYDKALDTIIHELSGLAMRGIPIENQYLHNHGKEEGKDDDYIYFQEPTDDMIRMYFDTLYARVEDVAYDMEPIPLPTNWRNRLD